MQAESSDERFMNAIKQAITEATEAAVSECIADAQNKIAAKLSEITAGVALRVMQQVSMERMGPDLHIIVKLEGLK